MSSTFETTAKEWQERIKEISTAEIEWKLEGLKGVYEDGYLYWGTGTQAANLAAIMKQTLPSELLMLQDPDYYEKAMAGMYPPPQPDAWVLVDQTGAPVERPHSLPGFKLSVFATEEEAKIYGQMIGLITPEMLQPTIDPTTGQQMPPQLPVQTLRQESPSSRWARLLELTMYRGQGPFFWEAARFRHLWNAWGKKLEAGQ